MKDPVSGLTHLVGAMLGMGGLIYLVSRGLALNSVRHTLSFAIFGVSLVCLYLASALYHLLNVGESHQRLFRRLDHSMIFFLIAGSYTPYCLVSLWGRGGWALLAVVWGLAIPGLMLTLVRPDAPRWLRTSLYLLMGWAALFAIVPLSRALTPAGFRWLLAGGGLYSLGAVIYAVKRPDPFPPYFGFHEIWHLFVLAGSTAHFLSIATLVE